MAADPLAELLAAPPTPADKALLKLDAAARAAAAALEGLPVEVGRWRVEWVNGPRPGLSADAWLVGDALRVVVIDAAGHGGPAGVVFALVVKQAVATTATPGEALARANRALVALKLADPPFASAAVADIDVAGNVTFARAGLPPAACGGAALAPDGPLLGVLPAAAYPAARGSGELVIDAGGGAAVRATAGAC